MAEIAPAGNGNGPNRLFIVLALGLAGLLILGVIALGGFFIIQNLTRATAAVPTIQIAQTTPTRALPTLTSLPTATSAPTETMTPTLVFPSSSQGSQTPAAGGTGTRTTRTPTGGTATTGELPKSGMGEDMLLFGGGLVLIAIIFVSRRARASGIL